MGEQEVVFDSLGDYPRHFREAVKHTAVVSKPLLFPGSRAELRNACTEISQLVLKNNRFRNNNSLSLKGLNPD